MAFMANASAPDLMIWTGPVWQGNLAGVKWAHPTDILTLSCVGSDNCANLARNVASPRLENILRAHGVKPEAYNKIMLGSFSAGHGFCQTILSDPPSLKVIDGFGAFDSYYCGNVACVKSGYLAMAQMAADGERVMWTSSSSFPDQTRLSCDASIQALLAKLDLSHEELPGDLSQVLKAPEYCVRRGAFTHAGFAQKYAHAEHAKIIAPAVMQGWISPLLHGEPPASTWKIYAAVGAAVGVAALGMFALRKRARG